MVDRNKQFLNNRALEKQFGAQLQQGSMAVRDRFGVAISAGALVIFAPPYDLIFQVVSAEPLISLDPRFPVPPGRMKLVLQTEFPLMLLANQPQMNMIHCGMTDGIAHSEVKSPDAAAAPAAEAPTDAPASSVVDGGFGPPTPPGEEPTDG